MRLLEPYPLGDLTLANRLVMAPMTRNRAPGCLPNELIARYYVQHAEWRRRRESVVTFSAAICGLDAIAGLAYLHIVEAPVRAPLHREPRSRCAYPPSRATERARPIDLLYSGDHGYLDYPALVAS